jgi:hypothetical protein
MKMSLLDIVQNILNDLDSDEVNDIDDTVESQQVANIVKNCYNNLISRRNWPHLEKLIKLDSAIDLNKPTTLKVPELMQEMRWFKYDKRKLDTDNQLMEYVHYKYPDEFLQLTHGRYNSPDAQLVKDWSGTSFYIFNNRAPMYWTSFDDRYIVCDSYNKDIESTLQSSKTQCLAYVQPVWEHKSDAIPDLPAEAFANLVEEAKSTAFVTIKQSVNQKAEAEAQKQGRWLSRKAWQTRGGVRYPNYGRTGKK